MEKTNVTSKDFFKGLSIINFALFSGQAMFLFVALFLVETGNFELAFINYMASFGYAVLGLSIAGLLGGMIYFNKRIKSIKGKENIIDKMSDYHTLFLVRAVIFEIPSFFAVVFYMQTGCLYYLAATIIILFIYVLNRPSINRTCKDLELNPQEVETIKDPTAIIATVKYR